MPPLHRLLVIAAGLSVLALSSLSVIKGDVVEIGSDGTAARRKPVGAGVNVNTAMDEFSDVPASNSMADGGQGPDVKDHTVNIRYCSS
eukprot:CAMPEP_0194279752 /NCGR_PEP_ID=MMETSP0169-20130528/14106_1 /TAXON_ID=218684 /ORGANISM="Corethron pennatum, Strain L29A3" /LENGTH=87 /DNA_ID=CAMNT_0039024215 /DNA_START=51 /DNA_END=314 /DNA_ORIENTATION=-